MIIALNGKSGSGKDEIVKIIKSIAKVKVYHLSFAGALRDIICHMYGWANHPQEDKSVPDKYWSELMQTEWSMRTALITIGESIRSSVKNHWIALVQHQINNILDIDNSIVVISDLRTEDELRFVRSLGNVEIWHVVRPTNIKPMCKVSTSTLVDNTSLCESSTVATHVDTPLQPLELTDMSRSDMSTTQGDFSSENILSPSGCMCKCSLHRAIALPNITDNVISEYDKLIMNDGDLVEEVKKALL